jgi:hypothetical protein
MTLQQGFAFAIIIGMMGLFVWGRIRYDLVALLALSASVLVGIVPAEEAFSGFSDDIIVIVASALLVSAAVARSGIVEIVVGRIGRFLTSPQIVIIVLVTSVTILSAFVKNIGALAMLMPVAFQLAKRNNISPSCMLMPMAFGSLLGGTMTLIGTSPNVIVSRMREDLVGEPFKMFDFTPVGFTIAALGVAFLAFGYKLLPAGRKGAHRSTRLQHHRLRDGGSASGRIPDGRPEGRRSGEARRRRSPRLDHHPRTVPPLHADPPMDALCRRRSPPRGRTRCAGAGCGASRLDPRRR